MWVGQTKENGRGVYMLNGTSPVKVSDEHIEYFLNAAYMDPAIAYTIQISGHILYILTIPAWANTIPPQSAHTFVYDLTEKVWYQWTSADANGVEDYFSPMNHAPFVGLFTFLAWDNTITLLDRVSHLDETNDIYMRVVTPKIDGGNNKYK